MSKAIIIDDEVHCIETLKEKVNMYFPSIEIVAFFNKPQLAIDYLETNNTDIVFLDIEMQVINGFNLLEKVSTQWNMYRNRSTERLIFRVK